MFYVCVLVYMCLMKVGVSVFLALQMGISPALGVSSAEKRHWSDKFFNTEIRRVGGWLQKQLCTQDAVKADRVSFLFLCT